MDWVRFAKYVHRCTAIDKIAKRKSNLQATLLLAGINRRKTIAVLLCYAKLLNVEVTNMQSL